MVQGMTEAEAKRQQQRRAWDAEHLRSIGTKLTPVELARLDAYCFRIRTTRYSLLRTLVLEELAAYERENRVTLDAPRAATETTAERDEVARRTPQKSAMRPTGCCKTNTSSCASNTSATTTPNAGKSGGPINRAPTSAA